MAAVFVVAFIVLVLQSSFKAENEAKEQAAAAEVRLREAEAARMAADRAHGVTAKDLLDRIQSLQKQVGELEAAGRAREGELLSMRSEVERLRRAAGEAAHREEESRKALERIEKTLADSEAAHAVPGEAAAGPVPPKSPEATAPESAKSPTERPPPVGLGPTAVTDPGQVRKVLDGLNTLLAGVGGKETFRVASAEAVEEGRLLRARLEARGEDGAVLKSFKAGEVRFQLSAAAGTLAIKLREGEVIYPGDRTVPFLDGTYAVLLVVDPAPFRASGNPLIVVQ
jgi:hypothetical protein